MKNYAKIGNRNRKGKPAYRTPSRFIARKSLQRQKPPVYRAWHLAKRLDRKTLKEKK